MDSLLLPLLVSALAEIGDPTQLLCALLVARFAKALPVFLGIALAALVNASITAGVGSLAAAVLPFRAISLMLAVALLLIALGALFRVKPHDTARDWQLGPFMTSFIAFLILSFGDKSQFATAAFAARAAAPVPVAIGAAAGTALANLPAILLGPALPRTLPLRALRLGAATILGAVGLWVALDALRLI